MQLPKDNQVYPVDTVVRLKNTGEFAIIRKIQFMIEGKNFLHYQGEIEGRGRGFCALYHHDIELEALPE